MPGPNDCNTGILLLDLRADDAMILVTLVYIMLLLLLLVKIERRMNRSSCTYNNSGSECKDVGIGV